MNPRRIRTTATLAVVTTGWSFLAPSSAAEPETRGPEGAQVTAELRRQVLRATASEYSIQPMEGVWGVLMETGYPEGAASLVALADGTASLYFSTGGGVIGGGSHPAVDAAARRLVAIAARHAPRLTPTKEFPLPEEGDVRFYVLTTEGVVKGDAPEKALGEGSHSWSAMFFAGHEVIGGLIEVAEKESP